MFFGFGLSGRSVFSVLRPTSRRTVVVYANTSAAVKARADWVVTSSVALEIVSYLKSRGEKLIWGPDRHLGDYIRRENGRGYAFVAGFVHRP